MKTVSGLLPVSRSELDGGPGWVSWVPWINISWVSELSIVVLGINGGSGGKTDSDELINVLLVGEVLIEVILEMLDHVHVLLDEIVSSYFLEWEGLVVELIGGNSNLWVFALLLEGTVDLHGVLIVDLLESSRELGELELELLLGFLEREWAASLEDFVVDNLVGRWIGGVALFGVDLDGSDGSKGQDGEGESHFINLILLIQSLLIVKSISKLFNE